MDAANVSKKRKACSDPKGNGADKKTKHHRNKQGPKPWRTPKRNQERPFKGLSIEPGDAGIWATCEKGKEAKCVGELRDLLNEHAQRLYSIQTADDGLDEPESIEAEIEKEVESMKQAKPEALFQSIKLDIPCVMFFKTREPVEPVSFVQSLCKDATLSPKQSRSRWVKRLTPMALMGKASEQGLEEVARTVLQPYFGQDAGISRKFAIRSTIRNHSNLTRDSVISQVAVAVGPGHKVDLTDYDLLIIVEIYKNVCGMSVVGNDFEALKKYNLAELYASKGLAKSASVGDPHAEQATSSIP
ncbi:MAG: hypothetical protein M1835_006486 [Candelina submexicana]|nr:MAG: hypothetical protein M1835_006486 [Candelina submexicana]